MGLSVMYKGEILVRISWIRNGAGNGCVVVLHQVRLTSHEIAPVSFGKVDEYKDADLSISKKRLPSFQNWDSPMEPNVWKAIASSRYDGCNKLMPFRVVLTLLAKEEQSLSSSGRPLAELTIVQLKQKISLPIYSVRPIHSLVIRLDVSFRLLPHTTQTSKVSAINPVSKAIGWKLLRFNVRIRSQLAGRRTHGL